MATFQSALARTGRGFWAVAVTSVGELQCEPACAVCGPAFFGVGDVHVTFQSAFLPHSAEFPAESQTRSISVTSFGIRLLYILIW